MPKTCRQEWQSRRRHNYLRRPSTSALHERTVRKLEDRPDCSDPAGPGQFTGSIPFVPCLFSSGFDTHALEDAFITASFAGFAQEKEVITKEALGDRGEESPLTIQSKINELIHSSAMTDSGCSTKFIDEEYA